MSVTLARSPVRLLTDASGSSLRAHFERHGPLPAIAAHRTALFDAIEESGLTGRGGAGFPTVRKLRAVAAGRRPVVIANGTEGEPASAKDKALLATNPHLVLDGVLAAAALVGADDAVVAIGRNAGPAGEALDAALAERRDRDAARIRVERVPDRFIAGEESALVAWLNGGDARPTLTPPRPSERGVSGRPTLVQNVETLANLALIARYGPTWFRDRESALVTVRGGVRRPGVVEIELGTPIRDVLERCGGVTEPLQAFLVGGYFGTWVGADDAFDLPLSDEALAPLGAALGARTLIALPATACGLAETARVAAYLAGESAGQCGPCVFGLPAVADCLDVLFRGGTDARHALDRLPRLHAQIVKRGACAHPDGAVRLVESALRVFAGEIDLHLTGTCSGHGSSTLPIPHYSPEWR
jgi:NADH:ubiquinone oxidoreductase subunit F (NADH-binding)